MSPQVTNASAFEKGSLGIQVVLSVVTFGLYAYYWMYKTAQQLDEGTDADINPILALIPFIQFWVVAKGGEAVTDQSQMILFILFLVFGPAAWFLIQSGINDVAPEA